MSSSHRFTGTPAALLCFCLLFPAWAQALDPSEVVVIANGRVSDSVTLAQYYMIRRDIPGENLIIIQTTSDESISREDYRRDIQNPVLYGLAKLPPTTTVGCLVLMYGIPLKVKPPKLSDEDDAAVQRLRDTLRPLEEYIEQVDSAEERERVTSTIESIKHEIDQLTRINTRAAVDSEIALIFRGGYPLEGWLPNPHFLAFDGRKLVLKEHDVLIVSRLDGPDPRIVRRMIDDCLRAEQLGLAGGACFDARGPRSKKQQLSGYALYDNAIHDAAELVTKSGRMGVKLDSRADLFQRGECPSTALYCGWYSLSKYVDAFDWVPGSIGYHIASGECATLRRVDSEVWCKRMLEEGIGATIGPVYEPFVEGFPLPSVFFGKLLEGELSLAECYLVSLPYLSWQMVLIGDPLYRPFPAPEGQ